MKKVTIFVSAIENDFKEDKIQLKNFFMLLNSLYKDEIIFEIKEYVFENELIKDFKKDIIESDLVVILLAKVIEKEVKEGFSIALEEFNKKGKPPITIYFKQQKNLTKDKLAVFKKHLANDLKHYFSIYENIDTLKLFIMMQIKYLKLDEFEVSFNKGKVCINGETLINLDKVTMYGKNKRIIEIKKDLNKLTNEYYDLLDSLEKNPDDLTINNHFDVVAAKKSQLEKEIYKIYSNTTALMENMYENINDTGISQRQILGYQLFEQGDYEKALEVLNFKEILEEAKQNESVLKLGLNNLQINVNELLQRVKTLQLCIENETTIEEIDTIYKNIIDFTEKYNLKKEVLNDYAIYLNNQTRYEESITYFKKALDYYSEKYKRDNSGTNCYKYVSLCINIAYGYSTIKDYDESKKYYEIALNTIQKIENKSTNRYKEMVSYLYNNIALLYVKSNDLEKAESFYNKAIENRKELSNYNPIEVNILLAETYSNMAGLKEKYCNYKEGEDLYNKAINLINNTDKKGETEIIYQLSRMYNNFGFLYYMEKNLSKAEENYLLALRSREELYKVNPEAYAKDLAGTYNHLCVFYCENKNYSKSVEMGDYARKMYEKLSRKQRTIFDYSLANCYNNLAKTYIEITEYSKAYSILKNSLEIMQNLYNKDDKTNYEGLVKCLELLSKVKEKTNNVSQAFSLMEENIKILEEICKKYNIYEAKRCLAIEYNNYALQKKRYLFNKDSISLFKKSINVYKELISQNNSITFYLSIALYNLALVYKKEHENKKSEKCFLEATQLLKEYLFKNPNINYQIFFDMEGSYAKLLWEMSKYKESEKVIQEYIKLYNNFEDDKKAEYKSSLLVGYKQLKYVYKLMGNIKKSNEYQLKIDAFN